MNTTRIWMDYHALRTNRLPHPNEHRDSPAPNPGCSPGVRAMIRGTSPHHLLFLVVLIGGMFGWLYATSETVEVLVREKRVEEGQSRRGLPVDVHVLLTDRGRLPISSLPLVGYLDADEIYAGIRPGQRYRMRIASWPWSENRMILDIDR